MLSKIIFISAVDRHLFILFVIDNYNNKIITTR
jgi:hypothetical protein